MDKATRSAGLEIIAKYDQERPAMTDPKTVTVQERRTFKQRQSCENCGWPREMHDPHTDECPEEPQLNGGRNVALTSSKTGDE